MALVCERRAINLSWLIQDYLQRRLLLSMLKSKLSNHWEAEPERGAHKRRDGDHLLKWSIRVNIGEKKSKTSARVLLVTSARRVTAGSVEYGICRKGIAAEALIAKLDSGISEVLRMACRSGWVVRIRLLARFTSLTRRLTASYRLPCTSNR